MNRLLFRVIKEVAHILLALLFVVLMGAGLILAAAAIGRTKAHASESRTKIAIIDSGIHSSDLLQPFLCQSGHKDLTGTGLSDTVGHGTHIAGIIANSINKKTHCLVIIKSYHAAHSGYVNLRHYVQAVRYAIQQNVKFINISGGGTSYSDEEYGLLNLAVSRGITVVAAAGNDSFNLGRKCDFYPACYPIRSKSFYVVGNMDGERLHHSSNYGGPVTHCTRGTDIKAVGMVMTGTSQATARVMGMIASGDRKLAGVQTDCGLNRVSRPTEYFERIKIQRLIYQLKGDK